MTPLTKYDRPSVEPINNLRREMDRIFNDLIPFSWRLDDSEMGLRSWAPRTDMMETDNEYMIEVDLPGMSKQDITLNVQDNILSIQGERKHETEEEHNGYLRRERSFGSFERKFSLPASVKEDKIKATFKDGVLTVHIPKAEKSKRQSVKID
ncbi:MAG: Hsp20/alpha crystallin family protein [Bacteroidota bacterium]